MIIYKHKMYKYIKSPTISAGLYHIIYAWLIFRTSFFVGLYKNPTTVPNTK